MQNLWFGLTAGIIAGSLMVGAAALAVQQRQIRNPIEACRQEHNVYQCELVAVPVTAPTWVPQK